MTKRNIPEGSDRRRIKTDLHVAAGDEANAAYYHDDANAASEFASVLATKGWHVSSVAKWTDLSTREEGGEETGKVKGRTKP